MMMLEDVCDVNVTQVGSLQTMGFACGQGEK